MRYLKNENTDWNQIIQGKLTINELHNRFVQCEQKECTARVQRGQNIDTETIKIDPFK